MIFNDLALFTSVAEHLSFSAAAEASSIPLSRVSRRIAELEQHLGVKLFERTTRQVRLTEEGKRLLDRCQDPVEALRDVAGFADTTKEQTIRVTAPPLAARVSIGPKLLSFVATHPNVKIELSTTNAMLDFFRDNIDIAFRLGPLNDSSLVARRLWPVPYCFCAGDDFIKRHKLQDPISVQQLSALPSLASRQSWWLAKGDQVKLSNIVHRFDDLDVLAAAAKLNLGIAMLPSDMLQSGMRALKLIDAAPMARHMFAVYPSRRLLPARIRELIDHMAS